MALSVWIPFLLASIAISLSPGPGAFAAMGAGLNHGFARGQAIAWGLLLGVWTQTALVGAGLGALLATSALIRVSSGVRVIVVSRKMQALDQALFTHLGVEPREQKILALKSSVHFRAHFQPIAERVIVVAAPGPVVADPAVLPFTRLRPGLRLRPGANR